MAQNMPISRPGAFGWLTYGLPGSRPGTPGGNQQLSKKPGPPEPGLAVFVRGSTLHRVGRAPRCPRRSRAPKLSPCRPSPGPTNRAAFRMFRPRWHGNPSRRRETPRCSGFNSPQIFRPHHDRRSRARSAAIPQSRRDWHSSDLNQRHAHLAPGRGTCPAGPPLGAGTAESRSRAARKDLAGGSFRLVCFEGGLEPRKSGRLGRRPGACSTVAQHGVRHHTMPSPGQ